MTADSVTSADGTTIAYDRLGDGPPVVLVAGLLCTRAALGPLAVELARFGTVVNYDRRGRGDSTEAGPYSVERELEDLGAVIAGAGGTAAVYGHSSGAALALRAAAAGLPIDRLVLHEPPYGPDDEASTAAARQLASDVGAALAEGRRAEAIRLFMADSGLPPEQLDELAADPAWLALAPTMVHDFQVVGDDRGGTIPEDLVALVDVPTLVLTGGASPEFFGATARRLHELLPQSRLAVLDGLGHDAPAGAVAPVVTEFLSISPARSTGRDAS